jgi:hypothetical protein
MIHQRTSSIIVIVLLMIVLIHTHMTGVYEMGECPRVELDDEIVHKKKRPIQQKMVLACQDGLLKGCITGAIMGGVPGAISSGMLFGLANPIVLYIQLLQKI